jgi:protein TonB
VRVYYYIDADGKVEDVRIDKSSGHQDLDQAALKVARVMRFAPALNKDQKVPVWVSFPITFVVH